MVIPDGLRILHFLSVQRYHGKTFMTQVDSNFTVVLKVVATFPKAHHYILMPPNNDLELGGHFDGTFGGIIDARRVTRIPFNYPIGATQNRFMFDALGFMAAMDVHRLDFDILCCHQPEVLYQIASCLNQIQTKDLVYITFFHWLDARNTFPPQTLRLFEALRLSDAAFFHSSAAADYLRKETGANDAMWPARNIYHFPISSALAAAKPVAKAPLPPDLMALTKQFHRKYIVFNHRYQQSTNPAFLYRIAKERGGVAFLKRYPVVFTDIHSLTTLPGCIVCDAPLSRAQYASLMAGCLASVCCVDGYITWNLAAQDSIIMGRPSLSFDTPAMRAVLGPEYPYFFKDAAGYMAMVERCAKGIGSNKLLPGVRACQEHVKGHDALFKSDLVNCLEHVPPAVHYNVRAQPWETSKYLTNWLPRIKRAGDTGITKEELVSMEIRSGGWQSARKQIIWPVDGPAQRLGVYDDTLSVVPLYRMKEVARRPKKKKPTR